MPAKGRTSEIGKTVIGPDASQNQETHEPSLETGNDTTQHHEGREHETCVEIAKKRKRNVDNRVFHMRKVTHEHDDARNERDGQSGNGHMPGLDNKTHGQGYETSCDGTNDDVGVIAVVLRHAKKLVTAQRRRDGDDDNRRIPRDEGRNGGDGDVYRADTDTPTEVSDVNCHHTPPIIYSSTLPKRRSRA